MYYVSKYHWDRVSPIHSVRGPSSSTIMLRMNNLVGLFGGIMSPMEGIFGKHGGLKLVRIFLVIHQHEEKITDHFLMRAVLVNPEMRSEICGFTHELM